jgi:hypothetical protein
LQLSPPSSSGARSPGSSSEAVHSGSPPSAPGPDLRRPRMLRSASSALLASPSSGSVRMLSSASAAGSVAVYAVAPLPELLQRVRMAAVHSSVPHFHAEPAGSWTYTV